MLEDLLVWLMCNILSVYLYMCAHVYLVSLCLQGIVERSSLLKLLVELIHFLLMLLLQTLPLLLKLCQILETHQKTPPKRIHQSMEKRKSNEK